MFGRAVLMAAALVAASGRAEAQAPSCAFPDLSGDGVKVVGSAPHADGVSVDVAAMRIEGAISHKAGPFVDSLPADLEVMPFGTAFVVHVPAGDVTAMWSAIDSEGKRTLLAGSSGPAVPGAQEAAGLSACGAAAFASRSPTPRFASVGASGAVVAVEAQRFLARPGDVVLLVQNPPAGAGFEIVLTRFVSR